MEEENNKKTPKEHLLTIAEIIDTFRIIPRLFLVLYGILVYNLYHWFTNIETFVQQKCDAALLRVLLDHGEKLDFAQQLALSNKLEWIEYAKSDLKPDDIPSRPDLIYRDDWFTWKDFLGADIASVKRNVEKADAVFFIIHVHGRPNNVFQFGITLEGVETIIQSQASQGFRIVGLFYCDIGFGWESFADTYGRRYLDFGRNNEYVIPNINDFIFQIGDFVETISPPR